MTKARFLGHYTIAAFALVLSGQSLAADKVTLGHSGTVSEALYFIAAAHGYYKNEGLDVTHTYFDSAAKEIPEFDHYLLQRSQARLRSAGAAVYRRA